MGGIRFSLLVGATFLVGFTAASMYSGLGPKFLAQVLTPEVTCDAADPICQNRLRGRASLLLESGRREAALETFARAAFAGDVRAQFQLGWAHEQAYRDAIGGRVGKETRPIQEARTYGVEGLPQGEAFAQLIRAHSVATTDREKSLDDRRALAWLWYAAAARADFTPAMNNLAALYQYALVGPSDMVAAKRWYVTASTKGNPVAAFNLERLKMSCDGATAEFKRTVAPRSEDFLEPIFTQTRFRGREVEDGLKMVMRTIANEFDPEGEKNRPVPRMSASALAVLIGVPSYGKPIRVFDDETPEEANTIPKFGEPGPPPLFQDPDCRPAPSSTDRRNDQPVLPPGAMNGSRPLVRR